MSLASHVVPFLLCSSEEEEFAVSDNDMDSEAEVKSFDDSDFGSDGPGPITSFLSRQRSTKRWNTRPLRRRRPKGYSDDEELEETDEEEEEEEMGENIECFSKYSSLHVNLTGQLWIKDIVSIEPINQM